MMGPWLQFWPARAPDTPGNLFEPVRDGWQVRGGWSEVRLHSERRLTVVAGLLAVLPLAAVLLMRRRRLARQ